MINFGGVVVVPLQGAILVCYGWGAEGDDQFWWSGRGGCSRCDGIIATLSTSSFAKGAAGARWLHEVCQAVQSFFFLHCRTSARHGRSTTGISMWLRSNFPKRKKQTTNPPKTSNKTSNTHTQGKSVREICKLSETRWNIRAPLSPSNVLVPYRVGDLRSR